MENTNIQDAQNEYRQRPGAKDWWECQSGSAVIKAEPLFDGTNYPSRLCFSFIKHAGAKSNYTRLDSIRVYLLMTSGTSNGRPGENIKTGMCAETLASLVSNGDFARLGEEERKKTIERGDKFADPIFGCIGGSKEKTTKDGITIPCKFRRFEISPNMQHEGYLFVASECDGEVNVNGGLSPKEEYPNQHRIIVPVSEYSIRSLAENIRNQWTAYLVQSQMSWSSADRNHASNRY